MKKVYEEFGPVVIVVVVVSLLLSLLVFLLRPEGAFGGAFDGILDKFKGKTDDSEIVLSVDALPDKTSSTTILVTGTVTDTTGTSTVVVGIDGNSYDAIVNDDGTWSVDVPISAGDNIIVVKATNGEGKTDSQSIYIIVDAGAPALMLNPMPVVTANNPITISGTVTDDTGIPVVVVTIGERDYDATVKGNGSWFVEGVVLAEGENEIVIRAIDDLNNTSTITDTVFYDNIGPVLTVDEVEDTTTETNIVISGTVEDNYGVDYLKAFIGDREFDVTLNDDGTWTAEVVLADGNNEIEIVAFDIAGNSTAENVLVAKLIDGLVELSTEKGTFTYPTSGTFTVKTNTSGGDLTVESSDEDVATVSISGDTVTVKPGTKPGTATITVTSAAKGIYDEASATFEATVQKGNLVVSASGYTGAYDGEEHGISVSCDGATITYTTSVIGLYKPTNPTFKDVGSYTVYYKVEKDGYNTLKDSKVVNIEKAVLDKVPSQSGSLTYNEAAQSPTWNDYNSDALTIGGEKSGTNAGTYNATFTPTSNYKWSDDTTSAKTVKWTIGKADGKVELSATSGTVTYPTAGTFDVKTNASGGELSVKSSDEAAATVTIKDNTVTVKPGTKAGTATITVTSAATDNYKATSATYSVTVKNGTLNVTANGYTGTYDGKVHGISVSCDGATITYATSEEGPYSETNPTYTDAGTYTTYYKVEKAGYTTVTGSKTVVINKASISVLPSQSGALTYDSSEQAPSWRDFDRNVLTIGGTTKATNAGTYSATFTPTANYQWSDGTTTAKTVTWTIGKADGFLELNETSGTLTYPTACTVGVKTNTSGGKLSVETSDNNVATATPGTNSVSVQPGTKAGTATITVTAAATDNYKAASATYKVTVKPGTLSVNASGYEGEYDGEAHGITVSCDGATITYATSENGTYSSTCPTYKEIGTYTIFYKVEKTGYTTVTGSKTVVINKASISVLPSQSGALTYNSSEQAPSWRDFDRNVLTIGGTTKATNAGTYSATFTPTANYQWSDGTTTAKTVTWTIGKADGFLELNETSGTLTYPTACTVGVKTNTSGGKLSVETSNNNVATATPGTNSVSVQPGTKAGTATITVTAAATDNYKAASATYSVTVKNGTLNVTANDYTGTYDGKAHGISVSCDGATITYATSKNGTYGATNPTYTNVGTYTVYYKVEKAGYTTVTGSKTVKISNITYYVKYNGNGSTSGNMNDSSLTYGVYMALPANAFSKTDYKFIGWNTKADGSGTAYADKAVVNNLTTTHGETITLYAQWEALPLVAYAVVSNDDNSLSFYKTTDTITKGSIYNGKTASYVYTGFETKSYSTAPWQASSYYVTRVDVFDEISPVSTANWFQCLYNCSYFNLAKLDTSSVTDMQNMFYQAGSKASEVNIVGLSSWDTSSVTNMRYMFYEVGGYANKLNIVGLNGWDTSNVTNMACMFEYAGMSASTWSIGDLSNWDTSSVTNMMSMFNDAGENATTWSIGNISKWDTSNVTNMNNMFFDAGKMADFHLDLSGWNVNKVIASDNYNNFNIYSNESPPKIVAPNFGS